jgi:hypothetical protein
VCGLRIGLLGRRYPVALLTGAQPRHRFRLVLEELGEGPDGSFAPEAKLHRVALGRWPLVWAGQVGRDKGPLSAAAMRGENWLLNHSFKSGPATGRRRKSSSQKALRLKGQIYPLS